MTKKMIGLALLLALAVPSMAQQSSVNVPMDQKGQSAHALYGGYKYYYSNTIAENVICSGRCLLAGLYMATGAQGLEVRLRDTSVANGSGGYMFPRRRFDVSNTTVWFNQIQTPIRASNGISLQTPVTAGEVVVLYLDNL